MTSQFSVRGVPARGENPHPVSPQSGETRACHPRQPLLWAALGYSGGIVAGVYLWRPPLWWLVAAVAFSGFTCFFRRRRPWMAALLGLSVMFLAGALSTQLRPPNDPGSGILRFADGEEVTVTARVTNDGALRQTGSGGARQVLDVETERIESGDQAVALRAGVRVSLYSKQAATEADSATESGPPHLFRYGERLRMVAKLHQPRNFRNPGAFDYRGYLVDNGIAALGSAKAENAELLAGFVERAWNSGVPASIAASSRRSTPCGRRSRPPWWTRWSSATTLSSPATPARISSALAPTTSWWFRE